MMYRGTQPKIKLNHDQNRKKVCAPCGKKLTVKGIREVCDREIELIQKHINPNYNKDNPVFPTGYCGTCRSKLSRAEKNNDNINLPMLNYEDINLVKSLRSNQSIDTCNCNIYLTATSKAKNKRVSIDKIDESTGLFGASSINKLPDKEPEKKKRTSLTICVDCKQEIGKGIGHTCSIPTSSSNVVQHVMTLPNTQQEQVITSLLKNKIEESSGSSNIQLKIINKRF